MQAGVGDEVATGGGGDSGHIADMLHHGGNGDGCHDEDGGDVELSNDELLQTHEIGILHSGEIHLTGEGVECLAIVIPCRYCHSGVCVCKMDDIENAKKLAFAVLEDVGAAAPTPA